MTWRELATWLTIGAVLGVAQFLGLLVHVTPRGVDTFAP